MTKQSTSNNAGIIVDAIRKIAGAPSERIVVATVVSVDEPNFVCVVDPIDGSAQITEVRLRPDANASGMFFVPEDESIVIVSMINESEGFVIMVAQVKKIILTSTDLIQLAGTTIEILGSSDTAVRFSELKTAFDEHLGDFNQLVADYNGHVHPGVTAGAASTLVTLTQGTVSTADIDPAEVPEVKLGN